MRIALAQLELSAEPELNLASVLSAIGRAAQDEVDLLVFPEATMKAFNSGRLDTIAEEYSKNFVEEIRVAAAEERVNVIAGFFRPADTIERSGKTFSRVTNSLVATGPKREGEDTSYVEFYDKIHLFDAYGFYESNTVKPGNDLKVVEIPLRDGGCAKVGLAICFDVRFPEQFVELAQQGAEIIVLPTSWNDGPGKLTQWQTLTAARALDSTCYLAAAGAARPGGSAKSGVNEGPTGIGHSRLVAPDGHIIVEAGFGPQYVVADINLEDLPRVREEIPVLEIRKSLVSFLKQCAGSRRSAPSCCPFL